MAAQVRTTVRLLRMVKAAKVRIRLSQRMHCWRTCLQKDRALGRGEMVGAAPLRVPLHCWRGTSRSAQALGSATSPSHWALKSSHPVVRPELQARVVTPCLGTLEADATAAPFTLHAQIFAPWLGIRIIGVLASRWRLRVPFRRGRVQGARSAPWRSHGSVGLGRATVDLHSSEVGWPDRRRDAFTGQSHVEPMIPHM